MARAGQVAVNHFTLGNRRPPEVDGSGASSAAPILHLTQRGGKANDETINDEEAKGWRTRNIQADTDRTVRPVRLRLCSTQMTGIGSRESLDIGGIGADRILQFRRRSVGVGIHQRPLEFKDVSIVLT